MCHIGEGSGTQMVCKRTAPLLPNADRARPIFMAMKSVMAIALTVTFTATAAEPPAFDVASVKLSKSPDAVIFVAGGMMDPANGKYRVQCIGGNVNIGNWTLGGLISAAWDLGPGQLSGPAWLNSDRYDIAARTSPQTTQAELRVMLQSLLIERFKLSTHRETKELPAYALFVAKNGPKLHPSAGEQQLPVLFAPPARFIGQGSTMQGLANVLGRPARRMVVDRTGIAGTFDFSLTWSPDIGVEVPAADAGPSIFTSLQEQLGLRLEPTRSQVEILVVDHVEKVPTPN
jgi:uncharacterized protein (TIGR03435 family)